MKLPSTFDLILWGIAAACVAGVLFTVNHWRTEAAEYKVKQVEWKQTLAAKDKRIRDEIANTEKANVASNQFQGRVRTLEDQRTGDRFPAVSLCRRPVLRLPQASAALGPDAVAAPDNEEAPEGDRDIGPALEQYGYECELNAIQLQALQGWVRNR